MAIVYKKDPLAVFLEELPGMISTQRRESKQMAQELELLELKFAMEDKIQQDNREYQLTYDLYKDSKRRSEVAEGKYDENILNLQKIGIGLDAIQDFDKTEDSKKILTEILGREAKGYKQLEEKESDLADYYENQSDALLNLLTFDIRDAQNIIAGATGGRYGKDKKKWDIGDFGFEAYEKLYGRNSDPKKRAIIKQFFDKNQALSIEALLKWEGEALSKTIKEQQVEDKQLITEYKKEQTEKLKRERIKDEEDARKADVAYFFNKHFGDAYLRTEYDELPGLHQSIADATNAGDDDLAAKYREGVSVIYKETGQLYAFMLGENWKKMSNEELIQMGREYEQIHLHSKDETGAYGTVEKPASYDDLRIALDKAWNNYKGKSKKIKKQMDQAGSQIFGYDPSITFEEFIRDFNLHIEEDSIIDLKGQVDNNKKDKEKTNILKGLLNKISKISSINLSPND